MEVFPSALETGVDAATVHALRDLARRASVELAPRQIESSGCLSEHLPKGTRAYIPFVPGAQWNHTIRACQFVRSEGMVPVPHLPARSLSGASELGDWLGELAEAHVAELMLVAGDRKTPAGAYRDTLDVLDSGKLADQGFRRIGVTAYPEGHPLIGEATLDSALRRKIEYASETGTDMWLVTQFAFEPGPVVAWLDKLRSMGCPLPVRVGLPGPARPRTLLAFAVRCGVGASAKMLARRPGVIRLAKNWTPDPVAWALAEHLADSPGTALAGIHLFTFGGLARTSRWLRTQRARSPADADEPNAHDRTAEVVELQAVLGGRPEARHAKQGRT